ncbi:MAG: hypothetical protein ACYC56_07115 [Candidatus Aquicultor sp.]
MSCSLTGRRGRVLAICLTIIFALSISSCGSRNSGSASVSTKQLQSALDGYLKKDAQLKHWKLLDAKVSVLSQQASKEQIEAVFDVERKYRLDYTNEEDIPVLKGRLAFLEDYRNRLSKEQLVKATKDIDSWRHDLNEYVSTDQRISANIKVVGKSDSSDRLVPGSTRYYIETDGSTGNSRAFAPLDLKDIPTPEEVEKSAYESIRDSVGMAP